MDKLLALLAANEISVSQSEIEQRAKERGFKPEKLTDPQIHELLTEYLPSPGSGTLATAQPKSLSGKGKSKGNKQMPNAQDGMLNLVKQVSDEMDAFQEELETGKRLYIDNRKQQIAASLSNASRELVAAVNEELVGYASDTEFFRTEARKLSAAAWGFSGHDEAE